MTLVSVIVPCYNEEATIWLLLIALYQQTYPRQELEVIIADGMSTDRTVDQIEQFRVGHPELVVKVVTNEKRTIPAGLNCAIKAAQGDIIVRLDAHSKPHLDYITLCVSSLMQGFGDNVGGVWEIQPGDKSWVARSIAAAAAHPLGVGDARYRYTDRAGSVDTVPFGAYRRELVNNIGLYDEGLLTNEDYEFNTRIRQAGGKVWLDPAIRSVYFARSNLSSLARQYWRYGFWKARMLRRYPKTIRWRQALPPAFVLCLVFLGLLSAWLPGARIFLALVLVLYLSILMVVGIQLAVKRQELSMTIGVPMAIAMMHLAWGSAFIWSLIRMLLKP